MRVGFIRAVLELFKSIAAIFLAAQTYPYITKFLRESNSIYERINSAIITWLKPYTNTAISNTLKAQVDLINGLPLPQFMKQSLISSNNAVIYEAMDVNSLNDYISGFLTNVCINIIALVIALSIITVLLSLLVNALDLIARLPVLNTFNKIGGIVVGFAQATVFVWICQALVSVFFSSQSFSAVVRAVNDSLLSQMFYKHNLIMDAASKFIM